MNPINFRNSNLVDIINWLTSLRSVTDFETSALEQLHQMCIKNDLKAYLTKVGLRIGNINTKFVLMSHIDRIGFIAVNGFIKLGSTIEINTSRHLQKSFQMTLKDILMFCWLDIVLETEKIFFWPR